MSDFHIFRHNNWPNLPRELKDEIFSHLIADVRIDISRRDQMLSNLDSQLKRLGGNFLSQYNRTTLLNMMLARCNFQLHLPLPGKSTPEYKRLTAAQLQKISRVHITIGLYIHNEPGISPALLSPFTDFVAVTSFFNRHQIPMSIKLDIEVPKQHRSDDLQRFTFVDRPLTFEELIESMLYRARVDGVQGSGLQITYTPAARVEGEKKIWKGKVVEFGKRNKLKEVLREANEVEVFRI